jgi:hypothetical protein
VFTTVFALFGSIAPQLWLVAARAGGLLALGGVAALAHRLAGPAAAVIAPAVMLVSDWWLFHTYLGNSEGMLAAASAWAIVAHLDGRPQAALPVAVSYGIDPVHFGVIMILNLGIGLNTPPVGAVQFVACAVGKISVWRAMRSIWPFYGAGLVVLGLVTYIPALSLWLPSVFK